MTKLFVYGTLRPAICRWPVAMTPVGKGFVHGFLLYHLGPYPALVSTGDPNDIVIGDIVIVDNENLARIDRIEGVPALYTRQKARAYLWPPPALKGIEVSTYVYSNPRGIVHYPTIEDWLNGRFAQEEIAS